MAQVVSQTPTTQTVDTIDKDQSENTEYVDRFLEGPPRVSPYDILVARGNADKTNDPDAKIYKEAKDLFRQGYDLCMTIPRSLDDDVLEKYEEDVKTASETMLNAWMMDDKAAPMSERILILGQQYEKVLLKNIPEKEKEGFFTRESLLFSVWILLVGRQYKHCETTLTLAIDTYPDLPARVFFLRASCRNSLSAEPGYDITKSIEDLEKALERNPKFSIAYFALGSIYLNMAKDKDSEERKKAIKNYELYVSNGHPDSHETIQSLYALAVLLNKQKKNEAKEYYRKAKAAEEKFKELYGSHTGLSNMKREAILAHEDSKEATRLIGIYERKGEQNQLKMQQLLQSGIIEPNYSPSRDRCSNCAATHLSGTKQNAPLSVCGSCRSIWYCSRECQVKDYKLSHKFQCKKLQQKLEQK